MKQQQGFTLIELIVVIVILGILAATAVPKFVDLQSDSRAAAMQGIAGSINSAKELVRARWLAQGSTTSGTVNLDATTTATVNATGYLTADTLGIGAAISIPAAVGQAAGVFTYTGFTSCTVTYTATSALATVAATAATCR